MLTSNRKGQIAEAKARVRAIELGFNPCMPVMNCRYDLVLDDGKKLWRVQVKYANRKPNNSSGAVIVKLLYETRHRKNKYVYTKEEVDALVVYIPQIDKLCWFPIEVFAGRSELSIRVVDSKNNQKKGIIFAADYFW